MSSREERMQRMVETAKERARTAGEPVRSDSELRKTFEELEDAKEAALLVDHETLAVLFVAISQAFATYSPEGYHSTLLMIRDTAGVGR